MGKVKKVTMDASQEAEVKEKAVSKKKKMTRWEELYTELTSHVAEALRTARVKPEQLMEMSDGEITAIEGISETGLEEIRRFYTPTLVPAETPVAEAVEPVKSDVSAKGGSASGRMPANKRHLYRHGKKIKAALSKVDRTKFYGVEDAVKLVKETNITSFDATVTLHINLDKDAPTRVELTFPHLAGATKKIAIASDSVLKDIEAGKLDFDILLTTPAFMPKLAKYAPVLGPKGLMPSPKSGTITPDPEKRAKEFAGGKTVVKAEPKFPLMHVNVGKTSQKPAELVANIATLIEAVKPKNIIKATLASTMSPGIKISLD